MPHPVKGHSYEELITNITNARIHNNIKLGHVERDFEEWFCQNFPGYCDPNPPPIQPEADIDDPTKVLRERVASFAGNRYQYAGSIELEPEDEIFRRATICAGCKESQEWRDGCACIPQIERTLVLLTQNKKTDPDLTGKGCKIAGHDNTLACMLPEKLLRHRKRYMDKLPDFCWLRTLEEAK